jgi:predicted GIY-YIG superfamily endonuclease
MSKRNRGTILTEKEKKIVALEKLVPMGNAQSDEARKSLVRQYKLKGFLSDSQWSFVESLLNQSKRVKQIPSSKTYYLYAIANGSEVKLGFSSNIPERIKDLQTANSGSLKKVWQMRVGDNRNLAVKHEKQLHKLCREHRIRSEWFNIECMPIVHTYLLP